MSPRYEFKCLECHGKLSVIAPITSEPKPKCPNCAGEMRKEFSPVSVTFKGSGFYSTDGKK